MPKLAPLPISGGSGGRPPVWRGRKGAGRFKNAVRLRRSRRGMEWRKSACLLFQNPSERSTFGNISRECTSHAPVQKIHWIRKFRATSKKHSTGGVHLENRIVSSPCRSLSYPLFHSPPETPKKTPFRSQTPFSVQGPTSFTAHAIASPEAAALLRRRS